MEPEGPPKAEDLDPQVEKRLFAILKGLMGGASVNELAERLGISRERYYELQRKVLRVSREALKPEKPGPKSVPCDPETAALKRENRQLKQELQKAKTLLDVAKRQAKGPQKDPDPPSPRGPRRQGHKGNRYPSAEKAQALGNLDQEKALGTSQADFCRATAYSPKSLDRWRSRQQAGALRDRPSTPLRVHNRTPQIQRERIVHLYLEKNGTYGSEALKMALHAPEGKSTIARILAGYPWGHLEAIWTLVGACHALDFMHLGPRTGWGRLLTLQDEASRFKPLWELRPSWSSQQVCRYLERVWEILGVPLILKHDQGSEFISDHFQGFLKAHRVLSLPSPPYRGSYNGKMERTNGFIRLWTRPVEQRLQHHLLPRVLSVACQDLNYERPLAVLGARTPYDVFSSDARVTPQHRLDLLQAAGAWATMQSADDCTKERGLWIRRKAAVVAAQGVGLLVICPGKKCQPVSA